MNYKTRKFPVGGVILVLIGIVFLAESLTDLDFRWYYFLILLGIVFYAVAFSSEDKGVVFPGTILLALGLIFLLNDESIIDSWYKTWPLFPASVGLAFIVLYICRPKDWGLLIPGGILIIFSIIFLADNYSYIHFDTLKFISRYWPLILIIIGVKLLLDSRQNRSTQKAKKDEPPDLTENTET